MNYFMHPPGKPNAGRWYSEEEYKKVTAHKGGKKLIVAQTEEGFGGFKHPKPILPPEVKGKALVESEIVKLETFAADSIANMKKKPEATPEPLKEEGETE